MKNINNYIQERLVINSKTKTNHYTCQPKDKDELKEIIDERLLKISNNKVIDLNDIDVHKITDMSYLFYGCAVKKDLDISLWEVDKVENMNNMFSNSKFTKINISGWKTDKLQHFSHVFQGCSALTEIIGIELVDISNVKELHSTFRDVNLIKTLDLSKWNVSSLESVVATFENCPRLKSIGDISNWNIHNLNYMNSTFMDCPQLQLDIRKWNIFKNDKIEKYQIRKGSKFVKI